MTGLDQGPVNPLVSMGDGLHHARDAGGGSPAAAALANRPLSVPHPDRLSPGAPDYAAIVAAHGDALRAGRDSYVDPRTGLVVLTAGFLARRGSCCDSGCRHCPYLE